MSDCQDCDRAGVCDYKYKPCECFDYRKFVPATMQNCSKCDGTGWSSYPIRCESCRGCGQERIEAAK